MALAKAVVYVGNLMGPPGDAAAMGRFAALENDMAGAVRNRGSLEPTQSLNTMNTRLWNGIYTLASANTNPGLPDTPGQAAQVLVANTGNDNYQKVTFRAGQGAFERVGSASTWGSWSRVDAVFSRNGTLPEGTSPRSLTSGLQQGGWNLPNTLEYPDLPDTGGPRVPGVLYNFADGNQAGFQILAFKFGGGTYWSAQTTGSAWTDWQLLGGGGGGGGGTNLVRLRMLELATSPVQPFETTDRFTEQPESDAYMDWLAARHPRELSLIDLGASREGLSMRAYQLGDPTKPTMYIMASQHGDEPMGHEAAHILVRDLLESPPAWLSGFLTNACLVVTPLVNPDRLLVGRLNSASTDLNRNWATRTTAEVQAAASVLASHDVVLVVDAHEGANNLDMMGSPASAPEAAQSLKDAGQGLCDHLDTVFTGQGMSWVPYAGSDDLVVARNAIALTDKATTVVLEGPSLLSTNMYFPSVVTRRTMYTLAMHSVVDHYRQNVAGYVAAKASAV